MEQLERRDLQVSAVQARAAELLALGKRKPQVATELGVSLGVLYKWEKDPEFQAYLKSLRSEVQEQVQDILTSEAVASANTIIALRDGAQSEKIKFNAAQDILDRAGFRAVERIHTVNEHHVSPELVQMIKDVIGESKRAVTVDAEEVTMLPERGN